MHTRTLSRVLAHVSLPKCPGLSRPLPSATSAGASPRSAKPAACVNASSATTCTTPTSRHAIVGASRPATTRALSRMSRPAAPGRRCGSGCYSAGCFNRRSTSCPSITWRWRSASSSPPRSDLIALSRISAALAGTPDQPESRIALIRLRDDRPARASRDRREIGRVVRCEHAERRLVAESPPGDAHEVDGRPERRPAEQTAGHDCLSVDHHRGRRFRAALPIKRVKRSKDAL